MKKKFKLPKKFWPILWIVLSMGAAALTYQWIVSRGEGAHPTVHRPWFRSPAKPVGVRVGPVASPAKPIPRETELPGIAAGGARLAIILDDWGLNKELLRQAIALRRPVTLSVLPNLKYSEEIVREAAAHGLGVMLHMPMQSKNTHAAKEPEVITVGMPDVRIRRYLDEALASVPGVRGVNNHQGSAATSDAQVMKTVLAHLKEKNLFFVDSFVIATTQGPAVAREVGIPFAKRDVFIDNVAEVAETKTQLRKAIQKALSNRSAIAIGHDKAPTLEAIRQMIPEIEKAGVRLVLAEELVK